MNNEPILFRLNIIIVFLIVILGILLLPMLSIEIVFFGVILVGILFPLLFLGWILLR